DIQGNLLTVTDALARLAFRYAYDLAGHPLRTDSLDARSKRRVLDACGNPLEQRDSKGALLVSTYDELGRPVRLWARDHGEQQVTLRQHVTYGDTPQAGLPVSEARSRNQLGQPVAHYDEAGRVTMDAYDFKGNLVEKTRHALREDAIL